MKKLFSIALAGLLFWACNNTTNPAEDKTEASGSQELAYNIYGDTISPDDAVAAENLLSMMSGNDSVPVKVQGEIKASCAMKGCWMKMDLGNDQQMHVTFKDYGFFVPKDMREGKAIIEGYASVDTLDVDYLRHLAHDAGKSQEEIDAITEPEVSLTYVATGVLIEQGSAGASEPQAELE
jgi:hypothetical protein